jgi:CRISPR/Cas system endoribonuclease Cas6 (RAMP superfamily)
MSKKNKRTNRNKYTNQHASIRTEPTMYAQVGGVTYTAGREDDFAAAIFTSTNNSTSVRVQLGSAEFTLSGRQARTIQRMFQKHYATCGSFSAEQPEF